MPRTHPSQSRFRPATGARSGLVFLALLAAAVLVGRVVAGPTPTPTPRPAAEARATGVPIARAPEAGATSSVGDREYARRLDAPLRAAAATAGELVRMGDEKTRNIFALRDAQAKMTAQLDALDAVLGNQTPPPLLAPAVASYRNGSGKVRTAMDEAWAGFTHLDWDRVARATLLLHDGAATLERAVRQLEAPAGASPAAGTEGDGVIG